MGKRMTRTIRVALSVTGSAILLFSCADKDAGRASASEETMMTEYSEDLSVVMSQNGPLACVGQANGPLSVSGRFCGVRRR